MIDPFPLVIEIPDPAVRVALVSVFPEELPMRSCPSVYVVCPVPPYATPTVVPFHVPVAMVPRVVIEDCPTYVAAMSTVGFDAVPPTEMRFVVQKQKLLLHQCML